MKQDLNVQTQIPRQESHVKTLQKGQQRSSMGKKRVSSGGINSYRFLSFKRSGLKVEWIRRYENIKMLSLCTKYREARLKTPLGQKQNRNKLNFWAMGISWCPAQNLLSPSQVDCSLFHLGLCAWARTCFKTLSQWWFLHWQVCEKLKLCIDQTVFTFPSARFLPDHRPPWPLFSQRIYFWKLVIANRFSAPLKCR